MAIVEPLATFIARCDPGAAALPEMFVERAPPVVSRLRAQIGATKTARLLFVGPPGVGKTTALAHFEREAGSDYKVIRAPLELFLDLSIVSWHDLFILSTLWASERAGLATTKEARELEDALRPSEPRAAGFIEGGVHPLTGTQRFRNDHTRVQKSIGVAPAQAWDLAAALLDKIEKAAGKPPVLVFDGLERMGPDAAKQLYFHDGRFLRQLPCRTIVTAPLAMSFEAYFGDIEEGFFAVERLRAISTSEGVAGREFFREIALRRTADMVMSPDVIEEAVFWGGGLPRQFLHLLASAAMQAQMERQSRVDEASLLRARLRVTERWQYQLEPKDISALGAMDTKRERPDRARLLRLGALIEYEHADGTLKLEPNPLVTALLERRIHEELRGRG